MKISKSDKRDIRIFIKNADNKKLIRKLKKIGGFGEETAPIKILAAKTRFLVANKLQFQNYSKDHIPVSHAWHSILIKIRNK